MNRKMTGYQPEDLPRRGYRSNLRLVDMTPQFLAAHAENYPLIFFTYMPILRTHRGGGKHGTNSDGPSEDMAREAWPEATDCKRGQAGPRSVAQALELLCMARVAHRVRHSSSNGVPLSAEANDQRFKVLFLDIGLMSTSLGLSLVDMARVDDLLLVNSGAVAEQAVGQHLLYSGPCYEEPELHYWIREKSSSSAEVDFVISLGSHIVPVEVKAGKTGTLRSMHVFLAEKKLSTALRVSAAPLSYLKAALPLQGRQGTEFELLSVPLYLVGQSRRLVREVLSSPPDS